MEEISEKHWAAQEYLWVQLSEAAASEFDSGRFAAAAEGWKNAYIVAKKFDERDPRLAGSLNNFAIFFRINQNFDKAEGFYRRAIEVWKAASQWVDKMRLGQRARSSLFHLRMEQKHREQYDRVLRMKYHKLLTGGYAGTLNNLAELFHSTNRLEDAKRLYDQALQKRQSSMGDKESGARIIRNNMTSMSDMDVQKPYTAVNFPHHSTANGSFISRAKRHGWIVDHPAEFTDEGRLMSAIFLTYIVDHSSMCTSTS